MQLRFSILITFMFLFLGNIFAQNLINKNQQWNVLHKYKTTRTRCYKFTYDSIVQGKKYTAIEYSFSENFDSINSVFAGLIREADNKVYIKYLNGEEFTLYDFTVQQFDTIDLGMVNHSYPLSFRCDTVDSVVFNGQMTPRFFMAPLNESDAAYQQWIPGLGSTAGIVEIGEPQYLDYHTMMLCSHLGDSLIWKNTHNFCYFSNAPEQKKFVVKTGVDELEEQAIKLNTKIKNTNLIVKVYDEYGDLVLKRRIKKEKDLNFSNLEYGIYTIQLTDPFDRVYALKKITILN